MPKRVQPEECVAALAAGDPPRSEHYPDDDSAWHAAQNDWIERWKPGTLLPPPNDKKRRKDWKDLKNKHARHLEAAQALPAAVPAAPDPRAAAPAAGAPTMPDAAAAPAAAAAVPAAAASVSREELRALRRDCLGAGVEYSISDTIDELQERLAQAEPPAQVPAPARVPAVPVPAAAPIPAAAPGPAAAPAPATHPQTRSCDCCGQLAVPYQVDLRSCWLCRASVCGVCLPLVKHHDFDVRRDQGSRTVQACRSCTARSGPPTGRAQVPAGVVRRDEASVFAPAWFAQDCYRYSSILCGYPWPPPMGGRYRFDMPEPGLYRVTLEYPDTGPPVLPPVPALPPCTGATDDDTADVEYWSHLQVSV